MLPETIGHFAELDLEYARDFKKVNNNLSFYGHLKRWGYWLSEEARSLSGFDWKWIKPLVDECREKEDCPSEQHRIAFELLVPQRILYVSLVAREFNIHWGAAYHKLRKRGIIDY